ncbi:unnamed protein product [Gadus morhua 'NCC']
MPGWPASVQHDRAQSRRGGASPPTNHRAGDRAELRRDAALWMRWRRDATQFLSSPSRYECRGSLASPGPVPSPSALRQTLCAVYEALWRCVFSHRSVEASRADGVRQAETGCGRRGL